VSPTKRKFAHYILLGYNVTRAADKVGRSKATGHRWIRLPEVKEYIAELEGIATEIALSRLVGLYEKAIDRLADSLDAGERTQLDAARYILDRLPQPESEVTSSTWNEADFDMENL